MSLHLTSTSFSCGFHATGGGSDGWVGVLELVLVDPVAEFGERSVTSGAAGSCGPEQEATTDTLAEVNAAVITARRSGRNWSISRTGGVPFREVLAELDQHSAVAFALGKPLPPEMVVHGGCSLGLIWRRDGTGRRRFGVRDQCYLIDACIHRAQLRPVQESVCDSSTRVPGVSDHSVDHRWYWAIVGAATVDRVGVRANAFA
ncbi:hypothetical protein LP422_14075 [Janibacter limosus]|uniref:Uncharacterized protein n=1 Tax=Janibacter limosus TaxID=53458 RepID=A0AC61U1G1_9MICO|nr:hypothetical protein [Janibacter limosus]UUZ43854.1 hypothetical protein LP422_14075 [Janibacter limosus]